MAALEVVIKTNNYQLFREDSEREKDLFETWPAGDRQLECSLKLVNC